MWSPRSRPSFPGHLKHQVCTADVWRRQAAQSPAVPGAPPGKGSPGAGRQMGRGPSTCPPACWCGSAPSPPWRSGHVTLHLFFPQLAGGVILGVALWLRHDPQTTNLLYLELGDRPAPNTFYVGIYILIAVGAVMMFVGFLGCYGAIQESQCLLGTFFTCLVILFACEVAAGIWGFVNKDQIAKDVKQFYDQALQQAVVDDDANNAKAVVKTFHETLNCCGSSTLSALTTSMLKNNLCPSGSTVISNLFKEDCHQKIDDLFSGKLYLIGIAAIVVAVIMSRVCEQPYAFSAPVLSNSSPSTVITSRKSFNKEGRSGHANPLSVCAASETRGGAGGAGGPAAGGSALGTLQGVLGPREHSAGQVPLPWVLCHHPQPPPNLPHLFRGQHSPEGAGRYCGVGCAWGGGPASLPFLLGDSSDTTPSHAQKGLFLPGLGACKCLWRSWVAPGLSRILQGLEKKV
uniref:CD81 molecule n=3 Tax=Boreoeutheria TaxID=1437010 RepID=A0A7N5JJ32_AILME